MGIGLSDRITQLLEKWISKRQYTPKVEICCSSDVVIGSKTSETITTDSTLILPANSNRLTVELQNEGVNNILLSFGSAASINNYNKNLPPASGTRTGDGGEYSDRTTLVYKGAIYGICETGTSNVIILEKERG